MDISSPSPDDPSLIAGSKLTAPDLPQVTMASQELLPLDVTVVFVVGGPGAGKSTQCQLLEKEYHVKHLSIGDILRAEMGRPWGEYSEILQQNLSEGRVGPPEMTVKLLRAAMDRDSDHKKPIYLVDGKYYPFTCFPRSLDRAKLFESQVCRPELVLFLDCPPATRERRLLDRAEVSSRADDNIVTIQKRIRNFMETESVVISYYDKRGLVCRIDCLKDAEAVYDDVRQALSSKLGSMLETRSNSMLSR